MKNTYKKVLASLFVSCSLIFSANAQWSAVGTASFGPGPDALITYNGDLYAGGGFFTPFTDITKWNGSAWSTGGFTPTQGVLAFATFDSVLYVATYNNIYQVIGASVSTIAYLNDPCYSLCFYNHTLYAGGWMDSISPTSGGHKKYVGYLAQYKGGAWDSLPVTIDSWVYGMTVYNNQLAVGGIFNYDKAHDTLYGVGLWNGTKWTPCKKGIHGNGVYCIDTAMGNLYIAGSFDTVDHVYCKNIGQWNGTNWTAVGGGQSGTVYAMGNFKGDLVAGGYYDSINTWNGTAWSCLGAITSLDPEIQAFAVYNGNLYASGTVGTIGGTSVNYIAEYTAPTSVNQLTMDNVQLKVYPNPSSGVFYFDASSLRGTKQPLVEVYNVVGQKVYSQSLSINNLTFNIDLSGNSAGIYVYRILSDDGGFIASGRIEVR